MAGSRDALNTPLITSAAHGRTLDVETRTRRYLVTMGIRTFCFLAFLVVPGWWKVAALVGAVVLPLIAVVLANNSDHRPPPVVVGGDGEARLALPPSEVIAGVVEDDE